MHNLDWAIVGFLSVLIVWIIRNIIQMYWKDIRYIIYSLLFHCAYWPSELTLWLTVKLHAVEKWTLDKRDPLWNLPDKNHEWQNCTHDPNTCSVAFCEWPNCQKDK